MSETLLAFLSAYRILILVIAGLISVALMFRSQSVRFWSMDLWYRIYGLRSKSKNSTKNPSKQWLDSENELCSDYALYVKSPLNETEFLDRVDYLSAAYDLGRKPLSSNTKGLIIFFSFLEALGFSYMLGSQFGSESSANTRELIMLGIAAVFGFVFPILMHRAGHSFRRSTILKDALNSFRDNSGKSFNEKQISLAENSSDRDQPHYTRCASRVKASPKDEGSFFGPIIVVLLVLGIAIGTTAYRVYSYASEQGKETSVYTQSASNPFGGPGGLQLPNDVTQPQSAADQKAQQEISDADRKAYAWGAIILAIIYIATQGVGLLMGYLYGFAGQDSEAAFKETMGCSTFKSYLDKLRPRIALAEARLAELQRRLAENAHRELHLTCTFTAYQRQQAQKERQEADKGSVGTHFGSLTDKQVPGEPSAFALPTSPTSKAEPAAAMTAEEALSKLDQIEGQEAKKRFGLSLDPALAEEVQNLLKTRTQKKAREEAKWDELLGDTPS